MIITILLVLILTDNSMSILGIDGVVTMIFSFIKLSLMYKNKGYKETNVFNLLNKVKVSGTIIGREIRDIYLMKILF